MRVVGYLLMVLGVLFIVVGLIDLGLAVWSRTFGATSVIVVSGLTAFILAVAELTLQNTNPRSRMAWPDRRWHGPGLLR